MIQKHDIDLLEITNQNTTKYFLVNTKQILSKSEKL